MTNWESLAVRDFGGVERQVGGQTVTQSGTPIFHQSTIPVASVIKETTAITLSTTPYDITLTELETFLIVDLSQVSSPSERPLQVSARYTTGGSFVPIPVTPIVGPEDMPSRYTSNSGVAGLSTFGLGQDALATDTGRVFIVACAGAAVVRFTTSISTMENVVIRQCVGTPPLLMGRVSTASPSLYYSQTVSVGTSYADGDSIGGTRIVDGPTSLLALATTPIIRQFSFATYGSVIGDFDVIFANAGDNSALTDSAALDLDYPESVFAWLEVRASPSAGQYKLRNFGASGGYGCVINDLNLVCQYVGRDTGTVNLFEVIIVNRGGAITPAADTAYLAGVVDL